MGYDVSGGYHSRLHRKVRSLLVSFLSIRIESRTRPAYLHIHVFSSTSANLPGAPSDSSFELTVGGGMDVMGVMRLQINWVRSEIAGYPTNKLEATVGGVFPIPIEVSRE
jgi:hypothetical protein